MTSTVDFSDDSEARSLLVLYATETGTAQDAADFIARQCRRVAFTCRVVSMDAYALDELVSEDLIVFVVSTTGSGVEPRSMTSLWSMLLRSDLPSDLFEDLPFAVFGLGDSSYEKFCWPAKKLSRRMSSLGAMEICERGEGDEQHPLGIDGALQPWTQTLLDALVTLFPLPDGTGIIPDTDLPPARVSLKDVPTSKLVDFFDPLECDEKYLTATVKENRRITAEDWYQDVRHLEFEFDSDLNYTPGDVAVIHPIASDAEVESFLTSLGWGNPADEAFKIHPAVSDQTFPDHLPHVTTLRTLFTRHLDFNAVPRRSFFHYLRHFTTDELEREKLDEFLSPEGADELYEYCYRVRRTIQEVLSEFRHVQIPKEYVFDVFPPVRPRQFSIASSSKKHPRYVQLCIAIVKYRTKLKIPRRGVCTEYISHLRPGDQLQIGFQKGLITLPANPSTPVICVGPGTGVAPMRAVLEERIHSGAKSNTLYFGCRSASKDQHYAAEWATYSEQQEMVYRVACSRDGPEGVARTYVQDLLREDAERVWKVVCKEGGRVYISGSSNKMPVAVREAVAHALETQGGYAPQEAKRYVEEMVRDGRLVEECWS